jgi:hypothetical protein
VEVMMEDRLPVYLDCDIKDNREVYLTDTGDEEHQENFQFWVATYRPKINHLTPNAEFGGRMFETTGGEADFLHSQPEENIWTIANWEREDFLMPGFHLANRFGYFVTEVPFDPANPPHSIIVGRYLSEDGDELERMTPDEHEPPPS